MNEEIKAKWVAALRSGKYKQAKWALNLHNGFCCLGVLCDIYSETENVPWQREEKRSCMLDMISSLPVPVQEWAGGITGAGLLPFRDRNNRSILLTNLNDTDGLNFSQIADVIENQL